MLSNNLKRLNKTNRLIRIEDMSDSILAGRSPAHTACWKHLQLASYDSALDHSENVIRREPDKPDGYVSKARALFKLKRFKEAEEVLLHAIKIAQQNHFIRSDVEGMNTYHMILISFMD
jgi:tetratricopeptide (TPR) repeat protein